MDNKIIVSTVFLALLGVFFLGDGLTGMSIASDTVRELCESDAECAAPDVCCLFSGKDAGVCNDAGMCESIALLTKEQYADTGPDSKYISEVILGVIIVIAIFLIMYLSVHYPRIEKSKF